jgi:hypothetical protein
LLKLFLCFSWIFWMQNAPTCFELDRCLPEYKVWKHSQFWLESFCSLSIIFLTLSNSQCQSSLNFWKCRTQLWFCVSLSSSGSRKRFSGFSRKQWDLWGIPCDRNSSVLHLNCHLSQVWWAMASSSVAIIWHG